MQQMDEQGVIIKSINSWANTDFTYDCNYCKYSVLSLPYNIVTQKEGICVSLSIFCVLVCVCVCV